MLFEDGNIAWDHTDLIISRYYPWGAKRISYGSIQTVNHRPQMTLSAGRVGLRGAMAELGR